MNIIFSDRKYLKHKKFMEKVHNIIQASTMSYIWLDIDGVLVHSDKIGKSSLFYEFKQLVAKYSHKIKVFIITGRRPSALSDEMRNDFIKAFNISDNDIYYECINSLFPNVSTMVSNKLKIICTYCRSHKTRISQLHDCVIFLDDFFFPEYRDHIEYANRIDSKITLCCCVNLLTEEYYMYEAHKSSIEDQKYIPPHTQTLNEAINELYNSDAKLMFEKDFHIKYDKYYNLRIEMCASGQQIIENSSNFFMFTDLYNYYAGRLVISDDVNFSVYVRLLQIINNLDNNELFEILFNFCKLNNIVASRNQLKIKIKEIFVDSILNEQNNDKQSLFIHTFLGQYKPDKDIDIVYGLYDFYRIIILSKNNNICISHIQNYKNLYFIYEYKSYDVETYKTCGSLIGTSPLFLLMSMTAIILVAQKTQINEKIQTLKIYINNIALKVFVYKNNIGAAVKCIFVTDYCHDLHI